MAHTLRLPGLGRRPDGEPDAAPEPETSLLPETAAPAVPGPGHALVTVKGRRLTVPEQALFAVRHAFREASRRARDLSRREGGWPNWLITGKPPSVREQLDYAASKGWLLPGHEGGFADKEGTLYQHVIGIPGVAAGNAISATCARQFRFLWVVAATLAVTYLFFLPVCKLAGLPLLFAAAPDVVLVAGLGAWIAVALAVVTGARFLATRKGSGSR